VTNTTACTAALYSACLLAPLLVAGLWLIPARPGAPQPWLDRRRAFWILFNLLSAVSILASLRLLVIDREPDSEPHFTPVAAVRMVARWLDDLIHEPIDSALYAMAERLLTAPDPAIDLTLAGDREGEQTVTRQYLAVMQQGIRARRPGVDRDGYIERIVSVALEADLPEEASRFLTGFTYRDRLDDAVRMVFDYVMARERTDLARGVAERFTYRAERDRALLKIERVMSDKPL